MSKLQSGMKRWLKENAFNVSTSSAKRVSVEVGARVPGACGGNNPMLVNRCHLVSLCTVTSRP